MKSKVSLPMPQGSIISFDDFTPKMSNGGKVETDLVQVSTFESGSTTRDLKDIFKSTRRTVVGSREYLLNKYSIYDYFLTISIKDYFVKMEMDVEQQITLLNVLFHYLDTNNYVDYYDCYLEWYSDLKNIHLHGLCKFNSRNKASEFKKRIRQFFSKIKNYELSSKSIDFYKISVKYNTPSIEKGIAYITKHTDFNSNFDYKFYIGDGKK